MPVPARRTAAFATLALVGGALVACTPMPETFWLANGTDDAVTVRWGPELLGTAEAGETSKIDIPWSLTCIDVPLRVVTEDGKWAAVVDAGPVCPDRRIEVVEQDLAPATAAAMVLNTTEAQVDLSFITGADLTAAPGERVAVALQVPAGECVHLATSQYESSRFGEIPEFWGGDLCDGEVKPLSLTEPATAVVENRTDRDLTLLDGVEVLGLVPAGTRAAVRLASTGCAFGQVRALDTDRTWRAVLPEEICPTDVLVVDELERAATATVTNATGHAVGLTLAGEMLTTTDVSLQPHASRRITLESPAGTCVLVTGEPDEVPLSSATWSGYLCDGATLTARIDVLQGGVENAVWEASW